MDDATIRVPARAKTSENYAFFIQGSPITVVVRSEGASTLLVLVLVLARLVLVGGLVWLLLVLVNLRPHYFSCSPGFGA
jgi:hypothetical protein